MAIDYKGQIDFSILTIREDEFDAVLKRFPKQDIYSAKNRSYVISRVSLPDNNYYLVALVRAIEQGEGHGQNVARDAIEDLDPQWLILVGIAGGVAAAEFTLGDVVVATRLIDFSVNAAVEGKRVEYATTGESISKQVQDRLALLRAITKELGDWNSEASIGMPKPEVILSDEKFYGSDAWKEKVNESLTGHFGPKALARPPKVTTGAIATSDTLVKDTETLQQWRESARQILAIEMELGGVYLAARQTRYEYPVLAVRGISDIVGFKRHSDWTEYACQSAASFTKAFILTTPVPPRMSDNFRPPVVVKPFLQPRYNYINSNTESEISESDPVNLNSNKRSSPILFARSLEELRFINRVDQIAEIHTGRSLAEFPNGVYGYTVPWAVTIYARGTGAQLQMDSMSLRRHPSGTFQLEIHKAENGQLFVVGFSSFEQINRLLNINQDAKLGFILFASYNQEHNIPVAISAVHIQVADSRSLSDGAYVVDMVLAV